MVSSPFEASRKLQKLLSFERMAENYGGVSIHPYELCCNVQGLVFSKHRLHKDCLPHLFWVSEINILTKLH